MSNLSKD